MYNASHVFSTTTARNNYFDSNPSELVANMWISVDGYSQRYLSGEWVWKNGISPIVLTGDAEEEDVLSGKTFYKDDSTTKLTGTYVETGIEDRAGTVTYSGTYASTFNTKSKFLGTTADGDVILVHIGSGSTSYENNYYVLASAPSGVTMLAGTSASGATGYLTEYSGCVFQGLTGKINLSIAINTRNGTYDYYELDITVTYA